MAIRHNESGSSLIEVMVALFVLAIGLLGVLAMQARSSKFNQSTYYYAQAAFLANDIADAMRTNKSVAASYSIMLDDPIPTASNCASTTVNCSAAEIKDWNIRNWRTTLASTLPAGKGSIETNGNFYTITVQFNDARSSNDGADDLHEYVLVTQV